MIGNNENEEPISTNGGVAGGGNRSHTTLLVNQTDKSLYLRDKVGPAYGGTRYIIPANSQLEVAPLQHTFFKMLPYAVEEAGNDSRNETRTIDTNLTIDSDQLADNKKIVISLVDSTYKLELTPRFA